MNPIASQAVTIVAGAVGWAVMAMTVATAYDMQYEKKLSHRPTAVDVSETSPHGTCLRSFDDLTKMPWSQLNWLYRQSTSGVIPTGFVKGRSFIPPEKCLSTFRSRMVNSLWRGKHFDRADCSVVNQWRIGRAIRGEVYYGTSWIDGKPAIIIDYRNASRVWSDARDELREVAPGLYVGVMHRQQYGRTVVKYYFVLESQCRE